MLVKCLAGMSLCAPQIMNNSRAGRRNYALRKGAMQSKYDCAWQCGAIADD
jgi:hypothetical protein